MDKFTELVYEMNKVLVCENQNWLLGAGISCNANIPLMKDLTRRVEVLMQKENMETYNILIGDLPQEYHVEHVLSHIGDYIAIAERSKNNQVIIGGNYISAQLLRALHQEIVKHISDTVRYGYSKENLDKEIPELVGSITSPIIEIQDHLEFAKMVIDTHANIMKRTSISIFTTNYDTLIEDAFSILNTKINDGFIGGAIGTWNPERSYNDETGLNVYKLHGSVDWTFLKNNGLLRTRYGVNYFSNNSEVLIYPKATKYVETQRDPFAPLFNALRNKITLDRDNILIICGYSFGDEHINYEIKNAMIQKNNRLTLIVFVKELNQMLQDLLKDEIICRRIYVGTSSGIYNGSDNLVKPREEKELNWWKFLEMTKFIREGMPYENV